MRFIGSLSLFALWQRPMRDFNRILKAAEGRAIAIIGPILFRQERFGFNNVKISVLKFRSMYTDR